ncbi:MAG: hypothetical protein RIR12_298 [Bacteroidota bacterium]|jgi:uncharacterized protein (DUF58 family)
MFKSFYFTKSVYYLTGLAAVFYAASYFLPTLFSVGGLVLLALALAVLVDTLLLYLPQKGIAAKRIVADRFSLGDANKVSVQLTNHYGYHVKLSVMDEVPIQFQLRNGWRRLALPAGTTHLLEYFLRPLSRGEYIFNSVIVFVYAPLQLVKRRYEFEAMQTVKVYPSYIQMRRYQLLAISNRLQEAGVKKIRKLGHSMEFEQIKEYVPGDDYRTINWKATARRGDVMVNNYTDERSQQIYCLINKGRIMKMPFNGLTLLDYAINASLVLTNVALVKQDRAGIITFEKNVDTFLQADKKPTQMNMVLETLYKQKTDYLEADFEKLFSVIRNKVTNRGLLVLFTNFESLQSLQRELPALKKMAKYHLLLVVFFENTALKTVTKASATSLEEVYIKTIAEKFGFEKRQMVKELHKHGIPAVLTTPENLTVNAINKYLELKTRMSI